MQHLLVRLGVVQEPLSGEVDPVQLVAVRLDVGADRLQLPALLLEDVDVASGIALEALNGLETILQPVLEAGHVTVESAQVLTRISKLSYARVGLLCEALVAHAQFGGALLQIVALLSAEAVSLALNELEGTVGALSHGPITACDVITECLVIQNIQRCYILHKTFKSSYVTIHKCSVKVHKNKYLYLYYKCVYC